MKCILIISTASLVLVAGCAGTARYDVRPFYDESGRLICCQASVSSSKDVGAVTVRVTNTPDGFSLDFTATDVSASAPITAGGGMASSITSALTRAAVAAIKLTTP